jgi:hypothetical protein
MGGMKAVICEPISTSNEIHFRIYSDPNRGMEGMKQTLEAQNGSDG